MSFSNKALAIRVRLNCRTNFIIEQVLRIEMGGAVREVTQHEKTEERTAHVEPTEDRE